MADYTSKHTERFWSKVDLSKVDEEFACWEWAAYQTPEGYGTVYWRGRSRFAHRAVYELAYGECPDHLQVLHRCDNPSCVNPNHLALGTNTDNAQDRASKGRNASFVQHGEHNHHCKLSDKQVADIRERFAQGDITRKQLAAEYGVTREHIGYIINRTTRARPSNS